MEFRICHLWPDALNANGSQGNVLCLRRRMEWRGHSVAVTAVNTGDTADFMDYDLVYIGAGRLGLGPGETPPEALFAAARAVAEPLRAYLDAGGALLAVCEGLELLGSSLLPAETGAEPVRGLDLAPLSVCYGETRLTGNLLFRYGAGVAAAFENHAGRILLKGGAAPLGTVLRGHGNNELDDSVGVRAGNLFGCSAFGPLLPRNSALADDILAAALSRRYPDITLPPLNDALETLSRQVAEKRPQ